VHPSGIRYLAWCTELVFAHQNIFCHSQDEEFMKVILVGATGMVGAGVLQVALRDPAVESVLVVGRKPCEIRHPKVTEIIRENFFDLAPLQDRLRGYAACFFCIGVTSIGKNEQEYRKLTYDLTIAVATTLSALNPDMVFCYVSGTGTDSSEGGRVMWARVKGKTENDLMKLPFKTVFNFRPGLIKPVDGQANIHPLYGLLGWTFPLWRLISPGFVCTMDDLGRSMIQVALSGHSKQTLENTDIAQLGQLRRSAKGT
jgi:hypothetical protein